MPIALLPARLQMTRSRVAPLVGLGLGGIGLFGLLPAAHLGLSHPLALLLAAGAAVLAGRLRGPAADAAALSALGLGLSAGLLSTLPVPVLWAAPGYGMQLPVGAALMWAAGCGVVASRAAVRGAPRWAQVLALAGALAAAVMLLAPMKVHLQVLLPPAPGDFTTPTLGFLHTDATRWARSNTTLQAAVDPVVLLRHEWALLDLAGGVQQEVADQATGAFVRAQSVARWALVRGLQGLVGLQSALQLLVVPACGAAAWVARRGRTPTLRAAAWSCVLALVVLPIGDLAVLLLSGLALLPDGGPARLSAAAHCLGLLGAAAVVVLPPAERR